MSRFGEIVFCEPLLFRRHVCLSNLKHALSRELLLTARETVFSHLKLCQRAGVGGGGVVPKTPYTGRLRPKREPFSGFRHIAVSKLM